MKGRSGLWAVGFGLCVLASPLSAQADSAAIKKRADSLLARAQQLIIEAMRAENDQRASTELQRYIDLYNARADQMTSKELQAVAIAVTQLGIDDPQLFKDALRAYDRAIAKDPDNLSARVGLGELFLDKYNGAEAKATLAAALAKNPSYVPALLAEAERRDFDHERGADSVLERALSIEPENVAGRVLRARFLADVEDFAGASREVDRALKANPDDAEALAYRAALYRATNDSGRYAETRRRYAALYPKEAGLHLATAQLLSRVRQYALAATEARQGVAIDPKSWRSHAVLGSNLFRLGDVPAAKASLETAFKGDPYDIWTKNTLELMDTYVDYEETKTDKFRIVAEKAESQLLSLYLTELLDRAYATFQKRYGFTPSAPVRVEVYRSHADFSVRTVGLAGIGALGVSFGNTIAFDSPAAKDAGPFNWGATAWHELAHTFTLGSSDMRVPRWLSEGLSVYEERRARPGWGQNVSPAFLKAYEEKKLVPASRLNDGFVRPAFPQQVILSYYQASLLCEMIARDFGEPALMQMLQAYRAGQSTEQVMLRVLRLDLPTLDRRFDAFFRERYGKQMAAVSDRDVNVEQYLPAETLMERAAAKPGNYWLQVAVGRALNQRNEPAKAAEVLERAKALFPEYGGPDGAYPALALARKNLADHTGAAETMSAMAALGDMPYEAHLALVDLWLTAGDTARAAEALENAMFMNPFDVAQHERLAEFSARSGNKARVIRERAAVVALRPVDIAEAQFKLALAYRDAGDRVNARRSVLRALEEAPHFERAQELLLTLVERQP